MTPRYQVALLGIIGLPLFIFAGVTNNLNVLGVAALISYVAQFLFAYYTTKRKSWEIIIGMAIVAFALVIDYPSLMFIGRGLFGINAQVTAWKILTEKETKYERN